MADSTPAGIGAAPAPIRFEALDALRGFAALAVALFHHVNQFAGYLAVDFFLVLSGYVLAHSLLSERRGSLLTFAAKRLARLWPLHVFVLVLTLVRYRLMGSLPVYADGVVYTFVLNLLLLQNVGITSARSWVTPAWSISVEFWVNLVAFLTVQPRTPSWKLLGVTTMCGLLLASQFSTLDLNVVNVFGVFNTGLIRGLGDFLLGIVLYRAWCRYPQGFRSKGMIWTALQTYALMLAVGLIACMPASGTRYDFLAPLAFAIVILVLAMGGPMSDLLARSRYLGDISYSIYLIHLTVLALLYNLRARFPILAPDALFIPVYLAATVVAGALVNRLVDQPLQRKCKAWLLPRTVRSTDFGTP